MTGTGERLPQAISLADFGLHNYTEKLAKRCQFFVLVFLMVFFKSVGTLNSSYLAPQTSTGSVGAFPPIFYCKNVQHFQLLPYYTGNNGNRISKRQNKSTGSSSFYYSKKLNHKDYNTQKIKIRTGIGALQSNLRKGQSPFNDVQVAHLLAVGFGEGATNPPQHLLTLMYLF